EALPQSAASLYRGLACRGACSQSQAQAGEAPACRRRAESSQTAARLPVPHPLRLCAGPVPPGGPSIARSRTGALGFMSFSLATADIAQSLRTRKISKLKSPQLMLGRDILSR